MTDRDQHCLRSGRNRCGSRYLSYQSRHAHWPCRRQKLLGDWHRCGRSQRAKQRVSSGYFAEKHMPTNEPMLWPTIAALSIFRTSIADFNYSASDSIEVIEYRCSDRAREEIGRAVIAMSSKVSYGKGPNSMVHGGPVNKDNAWLIAR